MTKKEKAYVKDLKEKLRRAQKDVSILMTEISEIKAGLKRFRELLGYEREENWI